MSILASHHMDAINKMIPPQLLMDGVGNSNIHTTGLEFLRYYVDLAGLKPHHRVLDVGCGVGRMAIPLTQFLGEQGSYEGFDIVRSGVEWCREMLTPQYPNFQFRHVDIRNKEYNPQGRYTSAEYRFPFETETFDFTFLTSVFTHMLHREVENYLREIARTLKVGGRCLITWFLLNEDSCRLMAQKKAHFDFCHVFGPARAVDKEVPERAISFEEPYVVNLYQEYGLKLHRPLNYGAWCGRERHLSFQDIVIATKIKPTLAAPSAAKRFWSFMFPFRN